MTQWIRSVIETFSYPGIAFLMLLETIFPPIPSELIVPLAGFVTSDGRLSFTGVVVAGTLGSVAGAVGLYELGRKAGGERLRRWADAHGRWVGLSRPDLEKVTGYFDRHGAWIVLAGRLVPGVRSLISIPAGVAHMRRWVFLIYTTIGSAIWTTALAAAGRLLGENHRVVEKVLGPVSAVVIGGLVLVWVLRVYRKKGAAAHGEGDKARRATS